MVEMFGLFPFQLLLRFPLPGLRAVVRRGPTEDCATRTTLDIAPGQFALGGSCTRARSVVLRMLPCMSQRALDRSMLRGAAPGARTKGEAEALRLAGSD